LVVIAVALPFLVLYALVGLVRLGLAAIYSAVGILRPKAIFRRLRILKPRLHHSA